MEKILNNRIDETAAMDPHNDIEMQHLVVASSDLKQEGEQVGEENTPLNASTMKRKKEGFFQRRIRRFDQRWNISMLIDLWGPYLQFVVRLMLVSTFLEDSFSTVPYFSEHVNQISQQGYPLKWFILMSPEFVRNIASLTLFIGVLAQLIGSLFLLVLFEPDLATKALIGWTIVQPLLYAQILNFEFLAESLSVVGGLLMLRAHLVFSKNEENARNHMQLFGRLLLPMMYLYYSGHFLFSAFTLNETASNFVYFSSLLMFIIKLILLVSFAIGSMLVAAGQKSRVVALLLAIFNLGYIFYKHPFFNMIRFEEGDWEYVIENMPMPSVNEPSNLDLEQKYNLHRYYFFLGLSTSGALLLLVQFGPGNIAAQEDEVIIPARVSQE
jgi:uncharacterized membrane protein YphA (DoxX/SURF4 family)